MIIGSERTELFNNEQIPCDACGGKGWISEAGWEKAHARREHPQTSHDAAKVASGEHRRDHIREAVEFGLAQGDYGVTFQEVADELGIPPQTASGIMTKIRRLKLLVWDGVSRRKGNNGALCMVYKDPKLVETPVEPGREKVCPHCGGEL